MRRENIQVPASPLRGIACALALAAAGCGMSRPSPIADDRPYIQVSAPQVTFEVGAFGSAPMTPASAEVGIANGGATQPTGTPSASVSYAVGDGWLTADIAPAPYGHAMTLRAGGVELLEAGTYTATVQVAWAGASNSPASVEVRLVVHPHPGMWQPGAPSVASVRYLHTTTALPDGGALVVGGKLAEAGIERLDPSTDAWAAAGSLQRGRQEHTATLLENGRLFVAGGRSEASTTDPPNGTWEIYDPTTGQVTGTGSLRQDRYAHAAVLLGDGRVLLVGGRTQAGAAGTRSCELFDPWTSTSMAVGALHGDASDRTAAVLLAGGQVLVTNRTAGGTEDGAELYDPSTRQWTVVEARPHERVEHALVALPDGTALVVGGFTRGAGGAISRTDAELFDPGTGHWSAAGTLRVAHDYVRDAAVLLPSGKVAVAGGLTDVALAYTSAVEVFDPASGQWSLPATLGAARGFHTVTVLGDGRAMSVGGWPDATHRPEFWREP